jgi:hypothetical protein
MAEMASSSVGGGQPASVDDPTYSIGYELGRRDCRLKSCVDPGLDGRCRRPRCYYLVEGVACVVFVYGAAPRGTPDLAIPDRTMTLL